MKVSSSLAERHSENDFAEDLRILSDSGAGVIHIRTNEVVRATLSCRQSILVDGNHCREWDISNGFREFDVSNMFKMDVSGDGNTDIHSCMAVPGQKISEAEEQEVYTYFTFINPQYWLDSNPILTHHLQQYCHILASTNIRVLLITPDTPLPEPLNDAVVTLHFDPPSHAELKNYLEGVFEGIDSGIVQIEDEELDRICYAGTGMSRESFEMYASLAIVRSATVTSDGEEDPVVEASDLIEGLSEGKTEVVNKNDILELYPTEDINDVGGMDNLKRWVDKRSNCYSDDAKDFGIEPPKGIVLVGIPGVGKSLISKAIASVLGVPLIRLDFGRVFNSLVGKSEERMRVALKMIESMAPVCVLAETLITLSDGSRKTIKDLYEGVQSGTSYMLRGVDPETNNLINLSMSTIIRSKGKDMLRIYTDKGSIGVTLNHKLLVERNGVNQWVKAKELKEGDDVLEY